MWEKDILNKLLISFLLVLILANSGFLLHVNSKLKASQVETDWWTNEWNSRRRVEILENSGYNLTNFPVEVTFQHDGAIQANGTDIRVIDNGIEIPSYVDATNSSHAKVIFETNLTALNTKHVTIYYNNPNASSPTYELVSLNISEGNTGYATIDNSVYIGWDYTSWGWSNNVELWNDLRIDFNKNGNLTDDVDLIRDWAGMGSTRTGGIGRHRRDIEAIGLGDYQSYLQTPIYVDIDFSDVTLRVYQNHPWVETTNADFLWMFTPSFNYVNHSLGVEQSIIDGSGWSFFYDSATNPIWFAFRDSSSGELLASSAFNIGNEYNYWLAAKESNDYDRVINYFGEPKFLPVAPYDQPPNCRIYWYGDNSNNYSKIEEMAIILNNQPTVTIVPDTITVPDDFLTIQEAINAANGGDTVFVRNGTYYENVVVNKSIVLIGEDKQATIIDGSGSGLVLNVTMSHANISGFTIQQGFTGIHVSHNGGHNISNNIVANNQWSGIHLRSSTGNFIQKNNVSHSTNGAGIHLEVYSRVNQLVDNSVFYCKWGVLLSASDHNVLRNNTMISNTHNFAVETFFDNDIDESNMINGKPIYYLSNQRDIILDPLKFPNIGYLGIVNSHNVTIRNVELSNNGQGILLANTNSSLIENVTILNNWRGIDLEYSNNNSIVGNLIVANSYSGIVLGQSNDNLIERNIIEGNYWGIIEPSWPSHLSGNVIYHNNFNNTKQHSFEAQNNTWDNGYEGNYWSNYNGSDLDGDGIGDTFLPWEGVDNYPLINPYWNPADIDHDLDVDIFDVVRAAGAYGSTPSDPHWNPHCDIAEPYGVIDIFDIVTIAGSYGEEYSP